MSTSRGSVLIAIKQIYQSNLIEKSFVRDNEYVIIECKRKNKKPLTIASIYVPSQKVICPDLLNKIVLLNNHLLILGDFNANHIQSDYQKTNKNGRVLFDWMLEQFISAIKTHEEMFQYNNYATQLDWIFSDFGTPLDCDSYTTHPLLETTVTGHRPITFNLSYSFEKRSAESAKPLPVIENPGSCIVSEHKHFLKGSSIMSSIFPLFLPEKSFSVD